MLIWAILAPRNADKLALGGSPFHPLPLLPMLSLQKKVIADCCFYLYLFGRKDGKRINRLYFIFLRDHVATFLNILGTLFFCWFFYGCKWKFRANLPQGNHRNQFFGWKRPLFDFFKKLYPFSGCDHEKWKYGRNHTFC